MIADFYGRKSNKDDGRSVESQETDWREDCAREGLEPGRVFADPDRSASRYAKRARPDYAELVEHIRSGSCAVLCLWEASRGSRSLGQWADLLELCRQQRTLIRIVSHGRTYDMSVRRDWRTLAEEGVDAHDESEKISERSQRGKRRAATRGTPASRLLYGYMRIYDDRGRYVEQVEHPDHAPIVREMARRVLAGEGAHGIARSLTERGIPAPMGGRWHGEHIRKTLTNPSYVAQRVHRGEVVGPAAWPAILDEETFEALAALYSDPSRRTSRGTELKWLLTGVIPCSACGEDFLRNKKTNGRRGYVCRCRRIAIQAEALDDLVTKLVLARLKEPGNEDIFAPRVNSAAVKAAKVEERKLRKRLDEHYAEAAAGNLTAAGLGTVEGLLLPQIEAAAAKARVVATPPKLRGLTPDYVVRRWESLTIVTRRDVVQAVVDLRVGPGVPGRPYFDPTRLDSSRWSGDTLTWGERRLATRPST